jgi:hypothetical protein
MATRLLEKKGQSLFVLVPAFPPEVGVHAGRNGAKGQSFPVVIPADVGGDPSSKKRSLNSRLRGNDTMRGKHSFPFLFWMIFPLQFLCGLNSRVIR